MSNETKSTDKKTWVLTNKIPKDLDPNITEEHITTILQALYDFCKGRELTESTIFKATLSLMLVADKFQLRGVLKKKVLLISFEIYLKEESELTGRDITLMLLVVEKILDSAIDSFAELIKEKNNSQVPSTKPKNCCIIS